MSQKRCFVVMGFGTKTDYATGRKLDLNKSYRLLIKPVVEAKGLACIRADEIPHSGSIDVVMYQELLKADVVIADLSTANPNAFYELGVRHALRRHTTIVISEDKLAYPFDLSHVVITSYTHLCDAIDYEEVLRFQKVLNEKLDAVLNKEQTDSPIYTFLADLVPPAIQEKADKVAQEVDKALSNQQPLVNNQSKLTISLLTQQADEAVKNKNFILAKSLFSTALQISKSGGDNAEAGNATSNNTYLLHRLAFVTYKSQSPDQQSALEEAIKILQQLDLKHTNDPETVALAGAIEKKLYESGSGEEHLSIAIEYFHRGFYLLHSRYNGINLAFLQNYRANSALSTNTADQVADMVIANRTRRQVLAVCEKDWNDIVKREKRSELSDKGDNKFVHEQKECESEQKFWILVNKAEAHFGLGEIKAYKAALDEATDIPHQDWMMTSFTNQLEKLRKIMKSYGHLLNPVWQETE